MATWRLRKAAAERIVERVRSMIQDHGPDTACWFDDLLYKAMEPENFGSPTAVEEVLRYLRHNCGDEGSRWIFLFSTSITWKLRDCKRDLATLRRAHKILMKRRPWEGLPDQDDQDDASSMPTDIPSDFARHI